MSWVWKADQPLRSEEECARLVHEVSLERGLDQLASVLTLMCIRQESDYWCPWNRADPSSEDYAHDSESNDGRSVGYLQQQNGRAGDQLPQGDRDNWWGPMSCRMDLKCSVNSFQSRLSPDYVNVKTPVQANAHIQRVQRSGVPDAYAKHWTYCWSLLQRALAGTSTPVTPVTPPSVKPPGLVPNPAWRGDPLYLPRLLDMFGVNVTTYTDSEGVPWDQRGHGDFGVIDYVIWHHTGSVNETDLGIAHHPALGLAANMLVHPDGHVVLTGSGVAWHAGDGIWPGVPRGGMNQRSIGIECAYSWGPSEPNNPWPSEQVQAMVNIGGAISWFLGDTLPPDHQISHKQWAGADNPIHNYQGKPDPANFNMNWFRDQIARRAALGPTGEDDELADPRIVKMIEEIHEAVFEEGGIPSDSPYAPDPPPRFWLRQLAKFTDASSHARSVESGALMGNIDDLRLMKDAADRGVERAVNAWHDVPNELKDKLANYPGDHAKE